MKLFKVEITNYPAGALVEDPFDDELSLYHEGWAPEGWLNDPEAYDAWLKRHGNVQFFWPSTKRLYQSRSGAQARAALIESYGAMVEVVESAPIVWLTADVRRRLRIEALEAELAALREAS